MFVYHVHFGVIIGMALLIGVVYLPKHLNIFFNDDVGNSLNKLVIRENFQCRIYNTIIYYNDIMIKFNKSIKPSN